MPMKPANDDLFSLQLMLYDARTRLNFDTYPRGRNSPATGFSLLSYDLKMSSTTQMFSFIMDRVKMLIVNFEENLPSTADKFEYVSGKFE
tara:strand:+ start:311 stop:580 length:270 start_codon:yes stop_codon:yes gene_type:complete